MGLSMITLGISYLVPVVSAATERRQLARLLLQLGDDPDAVRKHWERNVEALMSAQGTIALVTEHHLTHHVLRYYHADDEPLSLAVRTSVVWSALRRGPPAGGESDEPPDPRVDLLLAALVDLACAMTRAEEDEHEVMAALLRADGREHHIAKIEEAQQEPPEVDRGALR